MITLADDTSWIHRALFPKPGAPGSPIQVITEAQAILDIARDLLKGKYKTASVYIKPDRPFNGHTHTAEQIVEPVSVLGICSVPDRPEESVLSLRWSVGGDPHRSCGHVKVGDIQQIWVRSDRR